ncbi:class II fructose-bisphosphatase [Candidatus Bandiella euplotis]|uniref:Fructose-1,6-bisphosphatase n=1 Tax=Candidatus Bandiella euplotis TaxID=1664265 RepID=A0ABZ0UMC6_9RICK|nr:class II fructose-bisphosphatase [Candidatus Bandiella woodruffii]WPX96874.1 Fructose-1,6-bisphosphatase class 2 [Candidatus Bandiella woodruffii]
MLDRWLFEALKVTETTAVGCYDWIGKGNNIAADQAAVNAMREALNALPFDGRIVIGEGERDAAPMLYIGEKVGAGGEVIEVAVDPLEGTNICARGDYGSMVVMALSTAGSFLNAPDIYMEKIVIGPDYPEEIICVNDGTRENLTRLAKHKKCRTDDLVVMILDRERHKNSIDGARALGAKVFLLADGDISAAIAAATPGSGVDMYIGVGGAPEGVLAAAALKCIGGQMKARLVFKTSEEIKRAKAMGIEDIDKVYNAHGLVKNDAIFSATGVTDGLLVNGIKKQNSHIITETLLMSTLQKKAFKIKTKSC